MPTPILVLNCGSSSIKYQVIDVASEEVLASGIVEKIGQMGGSITHKTGGEQHRAGEIMNDHTQALAQITQAFDHWGPSLGQVVAVAHRVVHGGQWFREPTVINDAVIDRLTELSAIAPLHNPPAIAGIRAAQALLPGVPHVAVFDTAFFTTLPAEAYTYAIDRGVAEKYGIRKYGFHGTSHGYVSRKTAEFLGRDYGELNQIVCHLGNGASMSAIRGGVAVETSMGMTPLAGLVMGTRSGDVDPAVFTFLANQAGMSIQRIDDLLNKHSGLAGMADGSSDFRDLLVKIDAGEPHATLALDIYIHRLVSYVGAYMAILGRTDALVFTAGVGENVGRVRALVCDRLAGFGVRLDPGQIDLRPKSPVVISAPDSSILVVVTPTNEELAMARETHRVIG